MWVFLMLYDYPVFGPKRKFHFILHDSLQLTFFN